MAELNDLLKFSLELEDQAREAWRPVSDPPTEADGDESGLVIWFEDGRVESANWWLIKENPDLFSGCQWARVRDIVLMPPEGEGK